MGFRPFICRLASQHGLLGEVDNRTNGVYVTVQGDIKTIDRFSNDILRFAPPASHIKSIEINTTQFTGFDSFRIAESRYVDNQITEISPDIAVCDDCLGDMENDPQRINYPFTNCTNCGPRFSIIKGLPYDRPNTTMKSFRMCERCSSEYNNILDRRFHAQPVACNSCGPVYSYKDTGRSLNNINEILEEVSLQIMSGKTVAVKGIGGYFLMCDALNNDAVKELRKRKHRDAKPFAVMFRNISAVRKFCLLNKEEEEEITSWRRPILILGQKEILSPGVSNGLRTTGAMLPYMPFHYLLFRSLKTPAVVLTSGNISDDPIIIDDHQAEKELFKLTGSLLSYNRQIENRTDDSVIRIIDHKPAVIRRSRGYVPRPVDLKCDVEGILGVGAELKNNFCIGKGNQAVMSQYIGDLKNAATFDFFSETIEKFSKLFRFKPAYIACDLHPDYLSTRYAETLREKLNIPLLRVQHHHAHIASCMAEYGIDHEVIGVSLDGTGYGSDGNIWGGEFFVADLKGYKRYSHFDYVPLPGGDKAITRPWRMAFSYLYKYFGESFDFRSIPSFGSIDDRELILVKEMIVKKINSPLTSGAGRIFDAVSSILGLCAFETFDSEAPMRLESAVDSVTKEFYKFSATGILNFSDTFAGILEDLRKKKSVSFISTKFHNTVAQAILETSERIREETKLDTVILSGGVFQNKYLLEKTTDLLKGSRFTVYTNHLVPANDGGISLGQLVITSKTRG
ncbi:MAG: hydrogenase maturation protein HypF [Bacteroidota bacterium]|nr:hydrogenase maturation protein HypF [Bacteroidota bacterium]